MCGIALPAAGTLCSSLLRFLDFGGWSECYFWMAEPRMQKQTSWSTDKLNFLALGDTGRTLKWQHFCGSGVSVSSIWSSQQQQVLRQLML
jgi:hypothetical protein